MENILQDNTVILGSGPAGIAAGFHLKQKGISSIIYEKDNDWGGLCGCFEIDGFRFDRFVHFTFSDNKYIADLFEKSSPTYAHPSVSYNYYHGTWLKHPAQNNLYPLSISEKVKIIEDFINRPKKSVDEIKNYGEWLRVQYGDYFAENFPYAYTRKYWGKVPEELETKWIGIRMHSPDLKQVLEGAMKIQDKNFYYTKFMKYPKKGGYRSILNECRKDLDIRFNKEVIKIDSQNKRICFSDGSQIEYTNLISSVPLTEMVKLVKGCPKGVQDAASKLHWTCGYQVSLGFNRPDVAKYLWFYIYDEDIPPARVYSPNLKSKDNVPEGCSSIQAEVFFAEDDEIPASDFILDRTIEKLKKICEFTDSDVIVKDIRFEKYGNVIFTPEIYKNRTIIRNWLTKNEIKTIGRFGEWDYLWSHQAFKSGIV